MGDQQPFPRDHHLGDPPFKALGRPSWPSAHRALMQKTWVKEIARRQAFFKQHNSTRTKPAWSCRT